MLYSHTVTKLTSVLAVVVVVVYGRPLDGMIERSVLFCTGKNLKRHCVKVVSPSGLCGIFSNENTTRVPGSLLRLAVTLTEDLDDKVSSLQTTLRNSCSYYL